MTDTEFLAHISFYGRGDFFISARYDDKRLTEAQTERFRSCTLGDLDTIWPGLLPEGVSALRERVV